MALIMNRPSRNSIIAWCALFAVVLGWSFIDAKDRFT
jgi:hypothetical protein